VIPFVIARKAFCAAFSGAADEAISTTILHLLHKHAAENKAPGDARRFIC
jgi:hypothetical protein